MRQSALGKLAVTMILAVALHVAPAFGAVATGVVVSGTVSSVSGLQIVVNGTTYNVQQTGSVVNQLEQVQPGEVVDLVLNGPAGASSTVVVAIHVRPAT
ncbi:MAG TPA: hypothetical protein VMD56_11540 [Steroidobacteraceae bacterium]|nr:hypothetical protein [Steroidobacteraceae bacterium]